MAIFDLLSESEVKIFENNAHDVVRARKLLKKSNFTLESNNQFSVIVKKMVDVALKSDNVDFKKRIELIDPKCVSVSPQRGFMKTCRLTF